MVADSKYIASPNDNLMQALLELRRCCDEKESRIRERLELSPAEYACVRSFPADGKISAGELSRVMGLSPSRGGRVIEQLVQKKLIERRVDDKDRRINFLLLSKEGERAKRELRDCLVDCNDEIKRNLTEEELERARDGLAVLLGAMNSEANG